MKLIFVTGNAHKLREARSLLYEYDVVEGVYDAPEIQSLNPHDVVRDKALRAYEHFGEPLFVEDVSLVCYALGALPGPYIEWFIEDMGAEGLADLIHRYDHHSAKAQCTIGYVDEKGKVHIIEGVVNGTIVKPKGTSGFGFDPIFLPEQHNHTYAQMSIDERNSISHRSVALSQFRAFLSQS